MNMPVGMHSCQQYLHPCFLLFFSFFSFTSPLSGAGLYSSVFLMSVWPASLVCSAVPPSHSQLPPLTFSLLSSSSQCLLSVGFTTLTALSQCEQYIHVFRFTNKLKEEHAGIVGGNRTAPSQGARLVMPQLPTTLFRVLNTLLLNKEGIHFTTWLAALQWGSSLVLTLRHLKQPA